MTTDIARLEALSDKLKALSHPNRLHIVNDLMAQAKNVTMIQKSLGIPQPSVSAHLSILKAAGLIQGNRSGQEIYYQISDNEFRDLISSMLK